jgi:hypothetical protein
VLAQHICRRNGEVYLWLGPQKVSFVAVVVVEEGTVDV